MRIRLNFEITVRTADLQTLGFHGLKVSAQQHMHLLAIAAEFPTVIAAQGTNTDHPNFHTVILVILGP
jgi:hypothetical protein